MPGSVLKGQFNTEEWCEKARLPEAPIDVRTTRAKKSRVDARLFSASGISRHAARCI
jgi:hypothetical protein